MTRVLFSIILIFSLTDSSGQLQADSVFAREASRIIKNEYWNIFKFQSSLLSGSAYREYSSVQDEHPYFMNDDWFLGTLTYNGNKFENIPLQFDISTQNVLLEHPASAQRIKLVREKIIDFSLGQYNFLMLRDTLTRTPQFYQLLEHGQVRLVAQRFKMQQQKTSNGRVYPVFQERNRFYLINKKKLFPISSRRALQKLLTSIDSDAAAILRKQHISFASGKEAGFQKMVATFNRLLK